MLSDLFLYQPVRKNSPLLLIILFAVACFIGVFTIYHHEMWRDESQAFLMVRDSKNLLELWQNVRYEGHPILWHFVLFFSYHLFPSIYTIQVVHLFVGLLVIALIVFYAPFSFAEKTLLIFSYFFSYEYLVISRNYSIGIFFLFLSICVYNRQKSSHRIIYTAVVLGLATNCNIYSFIIAVCLFLYYLHQTYPFNKVASYKSIIFQGAVLIFLLFIAVALLQLIAPADRTPTLEIAATLNFKRMGKILKEISEVFFYVPDPLKKENFWGSSVFEGKYFSSAVLNNLLFYLPQLLTLIMIFFLVLMLKKSSLVLLMIATSSAGLVMFMYFIFDRGLLRHTGAFFVLLIVALWLYRCSANSPGKSAVYFNVFFRGMLVFQFVGSVMVHADEIRYPFSGAKNAAAFLIATHRNSNRIILHPDFEGMSLLHYGSIASVFYPTINDRGSFMKFSTRRKPRSYRDIYNLALRDDIETMVFNNKRNDSIVNTFGYKLIYAPTQSSTVHDEDFWIYGKIRQVNRPIKK
ncbi:MAG: hypothetical protein M3040_16470 [Bacteroidota bacterium]|nr:hypothetical protein [Bacteroidota bacterium]